MARSNPEILLSHKLINTPNKFRVAIAVSKKVSKKAVERNKIRRILQEWLLKNIQKLITTNHVGYLLTLNLEISQW